METLESNGEGAGRIKQLTFYKVLKTLPGMHSKLPGSINCFHTAKENPLPDLESP